MSFEDKLKQKASEQIDYEKLDDVPDLLLAKILGEPEFKKDKRDQECCYLKLVFPNAKGIVQKYTKTSWKELNTALLDSGGVTELTKVFHVWEKRKVGEARNDRFFPTKATELKEP